MKRSLNLWLALVAVCVAFAADGAERPVKMTITALEPTVLFTRGAQGALWHQVRLKLENAGPATAARVRIRVGQGPAQVIDLGSIASGAVTKEIAVPDVDRPTPLRVELLGPEAAAPVATREVAWQPMRKWTLYSVFYSHGGVGFGNYPHRIRHDVRHATIQRALENCRLTDGRPENERFRYIVESTESVTSYLNSCRPADREELARRWRERQVELAALHNVANSEQMGYEPLARLFYLSNRHLRDLLGGPHCRSALMNDVVGVTWPMVTFCQAADVPYLFHGHNMCAACMQPADAEAVFRWQAPGGNPSAVLVRSCDYGGYREDRLKDVTPAEMERFIGRYADRGWPYAVLLLQNGEDYEFATAEQLEKINAWNRRWAYPQIRYATMEMFFDAVRAEAQARHLPIKTFTGDSNNQWADEDASHAWALGLTRRLDERIPAAERFATIAATLTPGGYPWLDIYQAYHRMMLYYEHGGGAATAGKGSHRVGAQHYETELREHREVVTDAAYFCDRALKASLDRLAAAIATTDPHTLVVFNPLARPRTDTVRFKAPAALGDCGLIDAATGRAVAVDRLPSSEWLFVAADVPATGYKTFRVVPHAAVPAAAVEPAPLVMENRFYRLRFDPQTGAIASLWDRELNVDLVDQAAPHKLGEYVYEQFTTPAFDAGHVWSRPTSARLTMSRGPVAQTMTAEVQAAGARRLTQRVTLYADLKRIDFWMSLDKAPSGRRLTDHGQGVATGKEGVFVAVPLAVPGFRIQHELPGAVVEPIRQQFVGSCTAFYAVRHFTDLANRQFGVTVSSVEAPLVEYGWPRSCPITFWPHEGDFESRLEYPKHSRVYLYLMNNMFDTAVRIDQRGPHEFHWSLRSHAGDWRKGQADRFGWDTHNPLLVRLIVGPQRGPLPAAHSFLSVDRPNVVCTTVKPAEANGAGYIVRLAETHGTATTAAVALPFCGAVSGARETSLVEDDRPTTLKIDAQGRVLVPLEPFGVKTVRVLCARRVPQTPVTDVQVRPVSDMEVALAWTPAAAVGQVSHYNVYRSTKSNFQPGLLQLVGRAPTAQWLDRPQLNFGGWLHNRLEPQTTYYYRVAAVDRWNNEGPPSAPVKATTLAATERSAIPLPVEGLMAVHVSEVAPHNYINLDFRTNCESDIVRYDVYRSTQPGFTPSAANRIGAVDPAAIIPGGTSYGQTPVDRRMDEFDHLMYQDDAVRPNTTYYYRVRAVDRVGQCGPFSHEAVGRTGAPPRPEAESFRMLTHPEWAIDGNRATVWASAPFGGGTADRRRPAWLRVYLPRRTTICGVRVVVPAGAGPLPTSYSLSCLQGTQWEPAGKPVKPKSNTFVIPCPAVQTEAIRLSVIGYYQPQPKGPAQDGIVRIAEVELLLPDGRAVPVDAYFAADPKMATAGR
jgi:hypothetical protein